MGVLEFGIEGSTPYLVMDFAPYGTLRTRYPRGERLPLPILLSSVRQVADALAYAHEHQVVHCDIKPENMLIDAQGQIVLSDFGIATVAHSSRSQSVEDVVGTVYYMAPEQLMGKPRLASDQYALGVVTYEWLTGELPFQGSFAEAASQQLFEQPPPLRDIVPSLSPAVEEVVLTALAKDLKSRFAGVQDFATALERASQDVSKSCSTWPMLITPAQQAETDQGDEVTLLATPHPGALEWSARTAPAETQHPQPHRPRPARSGAKPAVFLAARILSLVVGLALTLLLIVTSAPPARLVNAPGTKTATAESSGTVLASATTQATLADANASYTAAIPGPCDATSGARWAVVGTYQCLADALLLTRLQGNEDAGVYFSGSSPGSAALPLNYDVGVNVSHLQGAICVMVSSVFSLASPTTGPDVIGSLQVELCANQTVLVYALPPPNSPATPIYSASLAPQASYTVAISCAMPTCGISVNDSRITSASYANVTHVSNIGFTILGNDSAKVAAGSAEFDHFRFAPAH